MHVLTWLCKTNHMARRKLLTFWPAKNHACISVVWKATRCLTLIQVALARLQKDMKTKKAIWWFLSFLWFLIFSFLWSLPAVFSLLQSSDFHRRCGKASWKAPGLLFCTRPDGEVLGLPSFGATAPTAYNSPFSVDSCFSWRFWAVGISSDVTSHVSIDLLACPLGQTNFWNTMVACLFSVLGKRKGQDDRASK